MINQIYVYQDNVTKVREGQLKVGDTTREVETRIDEQYKDALFTGINNRYDIVYTTEAIKEDGNSFRDHDVHRLLKQYRVENSEWFTCNLDTIKAAILSIKKGILNPENRTETFPMRPEQRKCVEQTANYFNSGLDNRFLWNCKMRFGKTFTTYQLAKRMNWNRLLILTYKPAVEDAWMEDLNSHLDFEGWQFVNDETDLTALDKTKPIVAFYSFQDVLGRKEDGSIKDKHKWLYDEQWDCIASDEYHFGAWREAAKGISSDSTDEIFLEATVKDLSISTKFYLYLSGTPFRALESGEFVEDQIYNWTYADEQDAKAKWIGDNNPYESLPRLNLYTYKLPDTLTKVASKGEFNEFDLSHFFKASGEYEQAEFEDKENVQKWLNFISGKVETDKEVESALKDKNNKPLLPFEDPRLQKALSHTLWFLPSVASCYAMAKLLKEPQNKYFNKGFDIIVAAGEKAGVGIKCVDMVKSRIKDPLNTKTITLSCGKLTTGVTIQGWTGIFMLRSLKTPETYFQAAFRVQSPWVTKQGMVKNIEKHECYVFDFDPNRALKQIAEYACKLDPNPNLSIEHKVAEFIKYLPVLAYDGFGMETVDAAGLLDLSEGKTTASLLARGWESPLLLNMTDDLLEKLAKNGGLDTIAKIESFRKSGTKHDNSIIISQTDTLNKLKKKQADGCKLDEAEEKELDKTKKDLNETKEAIKERLKKFITRLPLFMYITDKREDKLTDVIRNQEPALFETVTGLTISDFDTLVDYGVFNTELMNEAVYRFRVYEESSISYTGINRHESREIGLW